MKIFFFAVIFCVSAAAARAAHAQQVELLEGEPQDKKSDSSGSKAENKDGMPQIIVPVSGDEWQEKVSSAAVKVQPAAKKEHAKPAAKKKSAVKAAAAPKTSSAPVKPVEVVEYPSKFEMQPASVPAAALPAAKSGTAVKTVAPATAAPAKPATVSPAAVKPAPSAAASPAFPTAAQKITPPVPPAAPAAALSPAKPAAVKTAAAAVAPPVPVKPVPAAPAAIKTAAVTVAPPVPVKPVPAKPAAVKAVAAAAAPAAARKSPPSRRPTPVPAPEPAAAKKGGFSVEKKHTVGGGDTLWDLSNKYYKDPYKWGKIYNANLNLLKNPDRIYPKEELVIPEVMEEVSPSRKKAAEITGGDTVAEGDLSVTDVAQPQEPAKPDAGIAAPAEVLPAQAVTVTGNDMKSFDRTDLSEDMPTDQKVWSSYTKVVPDSWREDGVVASREKTGEDSVDEGLAINGETVVITMTAPNMVRPGDYLSVYMKGSPSIDKHGKRVGKEIQPAGIVEVVSVEGRKVRARVTGASNIISKGLLVKVSLRR